jgi:hypothetical protein
VHVTPLGQTVPHEPQFVGSVSVDTSQPLAASMSQSAKPASHDTITQRLESAVHCEVAFGRAQVSPQKLQFRLVPSGVAHWHGGSPGQFTLPFGQSPPHCPSKQGHGLRQWAPQAPQFDGSFVTFASQPVLGSTSQSTHPGSHASSAHAPPMHCTLACAASAQALPQAPQFCVSLRRSAQTPEHGASPTGHVLPLPPPPCAPAPPVPPPLAAELDEVPLASAPLVPPGPAT